MQFGAGNFDFAAVVFEHQFVQDGMVAMEKIVNGLDDGSMSSSDAAVVLVFAGGGAEFFIGATQEFLVTDATGFHTKLYNG